MMDTVDGLAKALEIAIADGDLQVAQRLTKQLTELQARLSIEENRVNPNEPDNEITIRVHLEDKDTSGVCIPFKVRPSDTIRQLKRQMMVKFSFPEQVQRWIIGKRLPKDAESLYQCGIRTNDSSVFLYLVSCQSVGLTREEFNRQQRELQRQNTSQFGDGDSSLDLVSQQFTPPGPSADSVNSATLVKTPGRLSRADSTLKESDESESNGKPKEAAYWPCPACTYKNIPTRPGCEICGNARPPNYQVPENYVLPEQEVRRLRAEQVNDDQVRETIPGDINQPALELSPDDMVSLLDLNDLVNERRNLRIGNSDLDD